MAANIDDFNSLNKLQKRVIKLTYISVSGSLVVCYLIFKSQVYLLSIMLGGAISLLILNSKFNNLKKYFKGQRKIVGAMTKSFFFNYSLLFVILAVVKLYTELNVWLVFAYAFSSNVLLILAGIKWTK